MSIELIIFDLDGTLVDSCEDITQALNHCLKIRGISPFSSEEVKEMIGEGVRRLIEKVLERKGLSDDKFSELLDCFKGYYSEHIADLTRPYPEVVETLRSLEGIKKVVISNKLTELTKKTLESLGLSGYFQLVAGNDFFPEQKPSPLPVLRTMEIFNVSREKTLIVGDSDIDIKAGQASGVKTVAVTYGYRGREHLKDADFIIDKFSDLLEVVRNLSK